MRRTVSARGRAARSWTRRSRCCGSTRPSRSPMEAVARRAAVSPRTVYRHIPTRRDLTEGLWVQLRNQTGTRWPQAEDEISISLRRTFRQFEQFSLLTSHCGRRVLHTQIPAERRRRAGRHFGAVWRVSTRCPDADGRRAAACVAIAIRTLLARCRGSRPTARAQRRRHRRHGHGGRHHSGEAEGRRHRRAKEEPMTHRRTRQRRVHARPW